MGRLHRQLGTRGTFVHVRGTELGLCWLIACWFDTQEELDTRIAFGVCVLPGAAIALPCHALFDGIAACTVFSSIVGATHTHTHTHLPACQGCCQRANMFINIHRDHLGLKPARDLEPALPCRFQSRTRSSLHSRPALRTTMATQAITTIPMQARDLGVHRP